MATPQGKLKHSDLKKAGLMVTTPRLKILELLESQKKQHHMTADEIHHELVKGGDNLSLGTVYRALTQFVTAGLVIRRQFEKGPAYYELNRGDPHSHLVCVHCGDITEFNDNDMEVLFRSISKEHDCSLTDHSLVLYVTCPKCQD